MFYIEEYLTKWVVRNTEDENLYFGHFDTEGDAYFIVEMLNNGKLTLKGDVYGKESLEKSNSVY